MRTYIALLLVSTTLLTGCANSTLDRDFRRKVDSVSVHEGANFDPVTKGVSGTIDTTFHFRDPDAKTVKPPVGASLHFRGTYPTYNGVPIPKEYLRTLFYEGERFNPSALLSGELVSR